MTQNLEFGWRKNMEFNKGQDDDDLYNLIIDDEIIPDYFIKKSGEVYSKKRNANFKKLKKTILK